MCSTALFSQTGDIFRRRVVLMKFLTLDSYCSGGIGDRDTEVHLNEHKPTCPRFTWFVHHDLRIR
jgi:hypothetical protein